ncbi:MAG: redoxin domain-containing protein [Planctomycetes bacterium]|nr:redoxin domain-containing protein [Planctomycetota bacterium]
MKWISSIAVLALLAVGCGTSAVTEAPGAMFPDFALASHDGGTVTQADLLGSTSVIWFYPKASTPG